MAGERLRASRRSKIGGRRDDAAVARGGESLQHEADGLDADGGGDARALVQEQNRAGSEAVRDGGGDRLGVAVATFKTAGAPADAGEAVGIEGRFQREIFDAGGSAETGGADAGGGEGREAGGEFAVQSGRGRAPK